ncbi:MAG TPA: AMP-binding protein, partial [Noviherbaspirillum sp.]|nr:AMP-binding protein [Noviherbaspirillum sp.]
MTATAHVDTFVRDNLPPRELWPELRFDLPELQYPSHLNCAAELLNEDHGERTAILWPSGRWTYAELGAKVDRIAHVLVDDLGLVPGNRVLLRGANGPMLAAAVLAVWKAGCVAVPTMPLLRAPELRAIINKAQVNAALCAASLCEELDRACEAGGPLKHVVHFGAPQEDLERRMAAKGEPFVAVSTASDDPCL